MSTMNIGEEGFWWFVGLVESVDDPLGMGRAQVRIHNIHSDKKTILPTSQLRWAVPLMPLTSASSQQVGTSPTGLEIGSTVFGFFMDGRSAQHPVMIGTMPGIPGKDNNKHDVPLEARGSTRINKPLQGPEPKSAFAAKYPHNKVTKTKQGHVIEIDDTPGHERIHVYHKSGSYVEINEAGRMVTKVVNDNYSIIASNDVVDIKGNATVHVTGNMDYTVDGNINISAGGDCNITSSKMTLVASRVDINP